MKQHSYHFFHTVFQSIKPPLQFKQLDMPCQWKAEVLNLALLPQHPYFLELMHSSFFEGVGCCGCCFNSTTILTIVVMVA